MAINDLLAMSNKQKILQMVERWPDNIPFSDAIYHLYVLSQIDLGLKDVAAGRVVDHDELFEELERLCDEEESQAKLVESSKRRSKIPAEADRRSRRPKNGKVVHKPAKKIRNKAS